LVDVPACAEVGEDDGAHGAWGCVCAAWRCSVEARVWCGVACF
jgi:hypothetical protein